MEKLGSQWTDFEEISYLSFRKSVEEFPVSFISDKNYG
jgi:hypothetical protein